MSIRRQVSLTSRQADFVRTSGRYPPLTLEQTDLHEPLPITLYQLVSKQQFESLPTACCSLFYHSFQLRVILGTRPDAHREGEAS